MEVTGKPFLDEDLLAKRRRQRETLRYFPTWMVGRLEVPASGQAEQPDHLIVERALRTAADEELQGVGEGRLQQFRDHTEAEVVYNWTADSDLDPFKMEKWFNRVEANWRDSRVRGHADLEGKPEEWFDSMVSAVNLLVLADRVAADGYTDPRFTAKA